MRADIFQKALFAAARVACCAALFTGCNPKEPKNPTPDPDPNKMADSQPDSAPSDVANTADSCRAEVAAVFTTKTKTKDQSTEECCRTLSKTYDSKLGSALGAQDWPEGGECCALINYETAGCYPWGPPCPPSMPS